MKKLSKTEAELRKSVAYEKNRVFVQFEKRESRLQIY